MRMGTLLRARHTGRRPAAKAGGAAGSRWPIPAVSIRRFLALALLLGSALPAAAAVLTVHKSERRLVFEDGAERREFRIGLGFAPVGPKEREGDGRTPEGKYFVTHRNPNSRFFRSLGISYPNEADARAGHAAGRITARQLRMIVAANRARRIPPQETALGGTIFVHGRGAESDWTLGCVALSDEDMTFLFERVRPGDPITIFP